jgi:hypothetical protein
MIEEPDHVIRSALEWRQEQAKRARKPEPKPQANGHAAPLPELDASTFKGKQKPRQFLDGGSLIPLRNVALLGGDGGIGKSLLAVQLGIACTTGTAWLGMEVAQGPVIYFCAEDDEEEVSNRLNEICDAENIDLGEAHHLTILPMVGADTVLAAEEKGRLRTTKVYDSLCSNLEWHEPMLLILDNLADVFSGNENNRSLAKQFIGFLRRLCLRFDCTILLLGHPSLSGRASGTGESGSTAWNNSVRVRLYLCKPDGEDVDENARVLEIKKANYSASGTRLELSWCDHRLIRKPLVNAWDRVSVADLERVKEQFALGRYRVNEQAVDWGGNAVALILDLDIGRGIPAKQRTGEQNRLRNDVRIYLAKWVQTKSIYVVDGFDAHRAPTQFYSDKPRKDEGK